MPDDMARVSQVEQVRRRLTVDEPSPRSVFVDPDSMPWETSKFPGIKSKTLYSDGNGLATLLLEMEPGAEVPLHEHTAIEQTYVLRGRFVDEEGECLPGQFVWRPEGNTHVAWAGPEGATVIGIFLRPNIFADGRPFFTQTPKE
jgi:anti-sigma factor ChrR (cupin superfamily)